MILALSAVRVEASLSASPEVSREPPVAVSADRWPSSALKEEILTGAQGTPVRMAFAADSRRLAVAAVTSSAGQLQANLFVLSLAQGDPVQLSSGDSVPQWLGWLSGDSVLAL